MNKIILIILLYLYLSLVLTVGETVTTTMGALREVTPPRIETSRVHSHAIHMRLRGKHQKHIQEVWVPDPLQGKQNHQEHTSQPQG